MSHGGMGGGGGHCHSGHGGHHGHHGGGLAGHHADQSASWNMAMQIEKDLGRRPGFLDPRVIVGITLFVFVTLVSLPYTLDYCQNLKLSGKSGAVVDTGSAPDARGPSAASLSMVGATLFGGGVHLPGSFGGAGHAPVNAGPGVGSEKEADLQEDAASRDMAEREQDERVQASSSRDDDNENKTSSNDAIMNPADTPQIVNQSAQETVTQMLAASGMAQHARGNRADFGMAAAPVARQQMAPQVVAPPAQYAGVIPAASGNQYAVFVPQQFGQPAAAPAANIAPPQYAAAQGMAAQPLAMPTQGIAAQPLAIAAQNNNAVPVAGYDVRSPFNPQTSAISCRMGMRRQAASGGVPMASPPGADGSQRFRVFVNR